MAFLFEKFLNAKNFLVRSFNESLEKYEQEVCRYNGPCQNKKNLPQIIPPSSYGGYPGSEFGHNPTIVYLDVCLKGIGKYCGGPEEDVNFSFIAEENIVEF